jgi:hypothetical protein
MPRQNTRLESEGAEFLVLGNLLIAGIPAYKSYSNLAGYDLIAVNPERNRSARIQVKSRWKTGAEGFILGKKVDWDFVVVARLNRGSKDRRAEVREPEFYVLPAKFIDTIPKTAGWGKISFQSIEGLDSYRSRWDLVRAFLGVDGPNELNAA